ncbi:MAG: DUF721 domain-containing protein [Bacteroidaceae bacterium]|nr:DUF721 domain-containing protein [Bacteroidaceae bacterium]
MQRRKAEQVGDVVHQILRQQGLEAPLNEFRLIESWAKVLGPVVERYTRDLVIRNQTLYVKLSSPALRQELLMQRKELVTRLNTAVGAQVIANIVFS